MPDSWNSVDLGEKNQLINPSEKEGIILLRKIIPKGGTALDVGCFDGETTRIIADSADRVIGIDPARSSQ